VNFTVRDTGFSREGGVEDQTWMSSPNGLVWARVRLSTEAKTAVDQYLVLIQGECMRSDGGGGKMERGRALVQHEFEGERIGPHPNEEKVR